MGAKTFFEVLEEQVRTDLRKEIEAEVRAEMSLNREPNAQKNSGQNSAPLPGQDRLETWLSTHLGKTFFSKASAGKQAYRSEPSPQNTQKNTAETPTHQTIPFKKSAPKTEEDEPRVSATTTESLCAYEILRRESGNRLPASFSERELKSAWRKAALKSHPDRFSQADPIAQAQAAALFCELSDAYDLLESLF